MKKTYINPQAIIVCVGTQQLMGQSDPTTIQFGEGTMDGSNAAVRRHSFSVWDDDEEE